MKKPLTLALLLGCGAFVTTLSATAEVQSLRGGNEIASHSNHATIHHWQDDREPITRDYLQQPPLIPHNTEGYEINVKSNKCLSCHSWTNYRKANATKVSLTHFESRDGQVLANISARRYFCTQCHVPQVNAPALVENKFQSLPLIKGQ